MIITAINYANRFAKVFALYDTCSQSEIISASKVELSCVPDVIVIRKQFGTKYDFTFLVKGKDFFYYDHEETMDEACKTINGWLINCNDPQVIVDVLKRVTGVEDVEVFGNSPNEETTICYNLP